MKLDIMIDKLTPCLEKVSTGKILQTTFSIATDSDVSDLAKKGWLFDWTDKELGKANIYKLLVRGDDTIQGLVAAEVVKNAVYVQIIESAPHNLGANKQYIGVGGHLFAIAIKLSFVNGFGGYIYFDAKNLELANHYSDMLGATRIPARIHEYRMEVLEETAMKVIDAYTLEGDLNVE
ncbi:MAG: hypothetical protein FWC89_13900 [Defluviitaleaceae bacterium]|nr:hypothetical protein [Defluviitaleaceae bacterium]